MMGRLFQVEWLKLKNYKVFWVLIVMYFTGVVIVASGVQFFLEFLKSRGAEFDGLDPTIIPFYDFPDVWHNIIYMATFFKVILSFIVIISITNEISYKTLRQNVIDGLSKKEFLISKFNFIIILSLIATLVLLVIGLVTGMLWSHVQGTRYMFGSLEFVAVYFIETVTFLTFAFLVALLLKKAGFAIVTVFMYTLIFEPVLIVNFEHNPFIPGWLASTAPYWPIKAINNLIRFPYQRYVFMEVQDTVAIKDLAIVLAWLGIYLTLIYRVLTRKDL
ncbi:MAG: ABC transporter permease subunit [Cyclobacteriaceae bacterium]